MWKALSLFILVSTTPFLIFCNASPVASPERKLSVYADDLHEGPVLYVSFEGRDGNPGTKKAPLRSISAAAERATPGTLVLISGGTYDEQVITKVAGELGKEITFRGVAGSTVLDGSNLSWEVGEDQNQGLFEVRHPFVRVENLGVVHSKNSGIVIAANHVTISGCEVAWIERHAICTHTSYQTNHTEALGFMLRDIEVEGNVVHHATQAGKGNGQAISLTADGFAITGNRVYANRTEGIDIWLGASHGLVMGNAVYDHAGTPGIYVDGASYLRICGNRVFGNKHGIMLSSEAKNYETHHIWVYNNLVYDNRGVGCSIWDQDDGPRDVLFAQNTLIGNARAFSFEGRNLSAEVVNNLVHPRQDQRFPKGILNNRNTWLSDLSGFADPDKKDFHLTDRSPAIGQAEVLSPLEDDQGKRFELTSDFEGKERQISAAGALQLP